MVIWCRLPVPDVEQERVNFTEALSRAGTNHEIETLYVEQTDDLIFYDSNMTS